MRYFFFLEREGRGWTKGEFVLKSGDSLLWHEKKTVLKYRISAPFLLVEAKTHIFDIHIG